MKKTKKPSSTYPTTTRPFTSTTQSNTNANRPTTSTQLSTAESATSTIQSNSNRPTTSTTKHSITESATSTTQSSTNSDRPTSTIQPSITESATSTTQSSTNQPAISTSQPAVFITPTTTSPITPSRHTNVLPSSPIIQEEYEHDSMKRNRKLEELENVIDELHITTIQQDYNIIDMADKINFLMSTISTLIDEIDELHDSSQSEDQDSFEWVMEESSTNALRRSTSEATTRLNTMVEDDMKRKKAPCREVFLHLKEKGSEKKDKMIENAIPDFFNNLGDCNKTSRHELVDILRKYPRPSRNISSFHRDPEQMTKRMEAFRYRSIKNDKHTKKSNLDEIKKFLNKSDVPEISDDLLDWEIPESDDESDEESDEESEKSCCCSDESEGIE
ncbi:14713_t:CDS:2, partial [Cetraspora pellucida]